ncbi:MAG: MFS transporter [Acidimicrobiales bacterium]|jgi:MFS family permease|nr:MFS transporter [Acidimicrobiales bacterium]
MSARRPTRPLIFAVTGMGLLNNSLLMSSTPEILETFDAPTSRAGLLIACGTVTGIVAAPAMGFLADRFGRKRVLIPCLVVFGAFGALGGLAPSLGWLLAARVCQGIGSAGLINLAVVIISDHWGGLDRARLIGQNSAVITACLAVFPFLGGATTDLFGWRWMFCFYTTALVVAAVLALRLADPWVPRREPVGAQVRRALGEARRPAVAAVILLDGTLFFVMFGLFLTVMPIHLDEVFGLGPTQRGLIAAAPAVTSTVAALVVARARGRVSASRLVQVGMVVLAGTFLLMGVGPLWLLVAGAAVYGLAEGLTIPTLQDLVAEWAPEQARGAVIALSVGVLRLGQTTGPLAFGLAFGWWSGSTVFVLAGIGVLAVTGLVAASRIIETGAPAATR